MDTDVKVEFHEQFRPLQSLETLGLDEVNLLNVLSQSEPFGVWRLELDIVTDEFTDTAVIEFRL